MRTIAAVMSTTPVDDDAILEAARLIQEGMEALERRERQVRERTEQQIRSADERAQALVADAEQRAAQIVREAEDRANEVYSTMARRRADLEKPLSGLRAAVARLQAGGASAPSDDGSLASSQAGTSGLRSGH